MNLAQEECIFCLDQYEENVLIENDFFYARFDNYPVSKGHTLIISKKHILSFCEMASDEVNNLYSLLIKARELVKRKFLPDGFNYGINEGAVAGQTIFHFHLHLIPRYKGDVEDPRGGVRKIIPNLVKYP